PTVIPLANGEILAIGGTRYNEQDPNKVPEVWQTAGGWRRLTTASKAVPFYPWAFQAPNGKVFLAGNWPKTFYLDTSGTGRWTAGPTRNYANRSYGSVVMYDTGRILALGGGNPATATAEWIDLRAKTPKWRTTASMQYARRYPNATVLPDGKVLVTGGSAGPNDARVAAMTPEMWDPATGKWGSMAPMQVPRLYHSSAVLLPDGRVLSAGGGRPASKHGVENFNAEIYSPPYLFRGPRPVIAASPSRIGFGSRCTVQIDAARPITMVNLIRLSSATHCFNMGQRFLRLAFSAGSGGLSVTGPASGKIAPPGHYLLHVVDDDGVPSEGAIVQVG
ncbi:MAG: galactose oxidase-like domain-containing protein, partial [Geminicoccaceae bacterium]